MSNEKLLTYSISPSMHNHRANIICFVAISIVDLSCVGSSDVCLFDPSDQSCENLICSREPQWLFDLVLILLTNYHDVQNWWIWFTKFTTVERNLLSSVENDAQQLMSNLSFTFFASISDNVKLSWNKTSWNSNRTKHE